MYRQPPSEDEIVTTSLTTFSFSYSSSDYLLALPMLLLAVFALGILMIDLMLPQQWKRVNAIIALIGVAFSAAAVGRLHFAYHVAERQGIAVANFTGFMGSLVVDRFAIYFFYLFLMGAGIAILMSMRYLEIERENHGEFYALLLLSVVGMMGMAAGYDIVLIFISLELMAISTYVLVGFLRRDKRSNEAALKYLLLGAFSSGIFAYGLSLFYGLTGSTNLGQIAQKLQEVIATRPNDPVVIFALLTTTTGLLFKIAAVPFHQWAPDAYEGAPTSITGYMLLGLIASDGQTNSTGIMAIMIYLLVYTFMNLGAFAVITSLRRRNIIGDTIDDIAGLYFKALTEAILMLIFLLSLAGIPPLAGFWGKYFIFLAL